MPRRIWIVIAAGVLVVVSLAGFGLSHASLVSAGYLPWTPIAEVSTPVPDPNQPSPDGGLGNTRANIERVDGSPTGLHGTMIAYQSGQVAITFTNDRATSVFVDLSAKPITSLDQARAQIANLLPADRTLVGTLGAGPNRIAEIYQSASLARLCPAPSPKDAPGQIEVVYDSTPSNGIQAILLSVGTPPSLTQ
jgi:hypothetical protein